MKTGLELIQQERKEQIHKHHKSITDDVMLNDGYQLLDAARNLLQPADAQYEEADMEMLPYGWNEAIYRKMLLKPYKERLITAGALIAAEIDRIQNHI